MLCLGDICSILAGRASRRPAFRPHQVCLPRPFSAISLMREHLTFCQTYRPATLKSQSDEYFGKMIFRELPTRFVVQRILVCGLNFR